MIKAEFVLCGLEAVLDRPSMSFDAHQCIHARALRTPGGEEGQLAIWDIAADQQASGPDPVEIGIEVISVEIGQIKVGPVVEALALVPEPAERRCQASGGKAPAMFLAVPLTAWGLPQDVKECLALTPST